MDIREVLQARGYERVWDMSSSEQDRQYFEGTGVLVLDRVNGVAYVNISERAHPDLAQRWADELGYKVHCCDIVMCRIELGGLPYCCRGLAAEQPAAAKAVLLMKTSSACATCASDL